MIAIKNSIVVFIAMKSIQRYLIAIKSWIITKLDNCDDKKKEVISVIKELLFTIMSIILLENNAMQWSKAINWKLIKGEQ